MRENWEKISVGNPEESFCPETILEKPGRLEGNPGNNWPPFWVPAWKNGFFQKESVRYR